MDSYRELTVWQKSVDLCVLLYKLTETFPKSELYGLVSQMRRCCVGIPSNIAEGQRRGHRTEYIQFLRIAYGSGAELETQILIAFKIGYLSQEDHVTLVQTMDEIMKMLNRLINKLLQPTT
ncbi:MAG: four helix bundle protein [Candidatus Woykebacteria bacterium RIFCSPLOWO2_01_FULL_43_14]|uniref:Four helix bundle protein n=1 Tax=Candidatus Woykebacteria bacterium RIFCSPLOWO2_01_FULL_43_14 TaxID=1802605 RepID=A0A1G1WWK9_9BACT|nr:MAG: four helix bundle protein [Candidatus Woykebacteria bacterium RIFCSPLOWO2_01_FULL_43_14]